VKKYKGTIIRSGLFILLLLGLSLPALPVLAGSGIGLGPPSIDIENAFRGSSYKENITIFNTGDDDTDYMITTDGEAASWISVEYQGAPFDYTTEHITVTAGGSQVFGVRVTIPQYAANQDYTAKVTVTSIATGSGTGSGQGVSMAADCNVNIGVTGTQIIAGTVSGITAQDQETGYPLLFQVFFTNTGNVNEAPSIDVDISWADEPVTSFNYDDTEIGPSEQGIIEIPWDTTGHAPGNYGAHAVVNLDGQQIYEEDLLFQILPFGTLTRSGEIRDMTVAGTLEAGKLHKVKAVFFNSGQIAVPAQLTADIYFDGDLIDTIISDKIPVQPGREETLDALFTPEKGGRYHIEGQVTYEGKNTEITEIDIDIDGETGSQSSPPILLYAGIGVGAVAVIGVVTSKIWRRKRPAKK
jgi:hypothetical protein